LPFLTEALEVAELLRTFFHEREISSSPPFEVEPLTPGGACITHRSVFSSTLPEHEDESLAEAAEADVALEVLAVDPPRMKTRRPRNGEFVLAPKASDRHPVNASNAINKRLFRPGLDEPSEFGNVIML